MATLTDDELRKIRNAAERKANANSVPISWVKGAINAAVQAIDDALSGDAPILKGECSPTTGTGLDLIVSARVDTATTPYSVTFTNPQKKELFAYVCLAKYRRDS